MIIGFGGADESSREFQELLALVGVRPLGGVIYLGRNIRDAASVRGMNERLRAQAIEPLLIGVDEEGGAVRRLRRLPSMPATPAASEVGRMSGERSLAIYARTAGGLAELGFNLNFGPVADLALHPAGVIAGLGRSYGSDPNRVAEHAASFIRSHHAAGVETALKHFPGHGSVGADPHHVRVDASATWSPGELDPFRLVLARERPLFLMTSHQVVAHPALGGRSEPVTFSAPAVAYIRRNLKFDRLVITDDLTMGAITAQAGIETAMARAIQAGHDCVIVAEPGPDPTGRIEAAIARVADQARRSPALMAALRRAGESIGAAKRARLA
jgi:beta-N-acetylhexosaminidase